MNPEEREAILALSSAIAKHMKIIGEQSEAGMDDALLIKFTIVADWLDPDETRFISVLGGTPGGENLISWDAKGMLYHALHDHPVSGEDD